MTDSMRRSGMTHMAATATKQATATHMPGRPAPVPLSPIRAATQPAM
jgi:hypothetical protein